MKIVLLGPPGAGKGTQAAVLSKQFGIPTISTGAIIRQEIREGSDLGKAAEKYIEDGQLVPDNVIMEIVKHRISKEDCKNGFILDGVPRTISQAIALDDMGADIDKIINIEVSDSDILKRLSGRRECPSCSASYHIHYKKPKENGICDVCNTHLITRPDDTEETVLKRIEVYHRQTEPLIEFYSKEGRLINVHGQEEVDDTIKAVLKAVGVRE